MLRSLLLSLGILVLAACGGNTEIAAPASTPVPVVEAAMPEDVVVAEIATVEPVEVVDTAVLEAAVEDTSAGQEAIPLNTKLNLNTADGADYQVAIPNFSDRMVREFLEYRPYISIQQFRREIGKYVDEAQVAEYEQYIYVPVDVDESDEATLQQLPGVDETSAAELMAGRPYGSNEAFLAKLAELVSGAELAVAPGYLAVP